MFCEKCGAKLNDGDMFCEACGERVPIATSSETTPVPNSEAHSFAQPAPTPTPTPVQTPIPTPTDTPTTYQSANVPPAQHIKGPKTPKEKKKLSKSKKALIILIIVMTVIIALGITAVVIFFTGSAYSVYNSMNDGDYSLAVSKYNNEVADDFIQDNILKLLLNGRVDDTAAKFQNNEIEYTEAVNELNALSDMKFEGGEEKIDEILDAEANSITEKYNNKEIDYSTADVQLTELANMGYDQAESKKQELMVIEESRNAFSAGNDYYANGDYEEAITEYNKISESDENYSEAQTKLNELYPKYIDYIVEQADSYISFGEYESALSYINTAESILPENIDKSKLDEAKSDILEEYKSDVLNQVTELINEFDYAEAFDLLDRAIATNDDEAFVSAKSKSEENYVEYIKESVQNLMNKKEYTDALTTVNNALVILPDNKELTSLAKSVEHDTPICLTKLERIEFGRYTGNQGDSHLNILEDDASFDNIGINGEVFKNGLEGWIARWNGTPEKSWAFATYDLDSKYKTFSGTTGVLQSPNTDDFDTTLYIYGDDNLLYSQVLTPEKNKFDFNINVKNIDSLKIMLKDNIAVAGGTAFALSDLYLTAN